MSESGRKTLPDVIEAFSDVQKWLGDPPDVQKWLGDPLGCPGVVRRPSQMSI